MSFRNKSDENRAFDIIAERLENPTKFGLFIGLETHECQNIEADCQGNRYQKTYQRILKKKNNSVEAVDWPFWREVLVELEETTIVSLIESLYPYLSATYAVGVHKYLHVILCLAFIGHGAQRTEDFLILTLKKKESIKFYLDHGFETTCVVENPKRLKNRLFEIHGYLLKHKLFCFSKNSQTECNILMTIYEFFQIKNDGGFVIQGYDIRNHLKHSFKDYFYEQPYKDTLILIFIKTYKMIFLFDIDPPNDINEALKNNRDNIRCLRTLHGCLNDASITFCSVLLYSETEIAEFSTAACEDCKKLGLVTSRRVFEEQASIKPWWQSILATSQRLQALNRSNLKPWWKRNLATSQRLLALNRSSTKDVGNEFLKKIMEYMFVCSSFDGEASANNPRLTLKENDAKVKMIIPRSTK